jgi:hypothetical protein
VDGDGAVLTVTLQAERGYALKLRRVEGVVIVEEAPNFVQFRGIAANLNAALDGLSLTPPERLIGETTLTVKSDDHGSFGAGQAMSDTDVVSVVYSERPPSLTVGDVTVTEDDAGTVAAVFRVSLRGEPLPGQAVRVHYATADDSASAGHDYLPASGELVFGERETEKTVTVIVGGDLDVEPDEQFFLNLSDATGALIGDGRAVGTIANDDAPRPAPAVTQVFVGGSAWAAGYRNYLAAQGLGDAKFGYAVPAGAAQLAVLPWGNFNQVSVRFDADVLVLEQDLAVRGVRAPAYATSAFDYDEATHTATWTLAQPVVNDKIVLDLDGGPDGIISPFAVGLDGDWVNGADAYPSGDGTPGGDLRFRLNVLGGDVTRDGRVTYVDWLELRRRLARTAASPGPTNGPASYSAYHDPSGDGAVGPTDLVMVRRNLLRGLPLTEPAGLTAPSAAPSINRDLLGTQRLILG